MKGFRKFVLSVLALLAVAVLLPCAGALAAPTSGDIVINPGGGTLLYNGTEWVENTYSNGDAYRGINKTKDLKDEIYSIKTSGDITASGSEMGNLHLAGIYSDGVTISSDSIPGGITIVNASGNQPAAGIYKHGSGGGNVNLSGIGDIYVESKGSGAAMGIGTVGSDSGTLNVSARSITAKANSGEADGVYAAVKRSIDICINGNVSVTSVAGNAYGTQADWADSTSKANIRFGSLNVSSLGTGNKGAFGVKGNSGAIVDVVLSGDMVVESNGSGSSAHAKGVQTSGASSFDVTGIDNMTITAKGSNNAYGANHYGASKLNLEVKNDMNITSLSCVAKGFNIQQSNTKFTGSIGNMTVSANQDAYGFYVSDGATASSDINSIKAHSNTQTAYGIYASDSNSVVTLSARDNKADIDAENGIGVYARDSAVVNLTNVSVSADKAGDIGSGSFLNLTSSDIIGAVSNDGSLKFVAGTSQVSGGTTVSGTGTTTIADGAVVKFGSGATVSQQLESAGTIDLKDGTAGTKLNVNTFYGNGNNSKINFDVDVSGSETDITGSKTDSIVVATEASGDVNISSVNVISEDNMSVGAQKRLELFVKSTNTSTFNNLRINSTITVTSSGSKYEFKQHETDKGFLYITKLQSGGPVVPTLAEIIQNTDDKGVGVDTYSLTSNYTETADLGTLTRRGSESAREFTINGNAHTFTSSNKGGVTVNNGDTLNLTNLVSFNGFNGNAVSNDGTVDITDVLNMGSISNSGKTNLLGTNSVEGTVINSGEFNAAGVNTFKNTIDNSGILNAVGSNDFAESVTNNGTLDVVGINTFEKAFGNSGTANLGGTNVFEKDVTNTGTINAAGDNVVAGKLTSSNELNVNSGTTTVGGMLDVSGGSTIINKGGSLVVAEQSGQSVTFSSAAKSFVVNEGGKFTVDAFNGNVIKNNYDLVDGLSGVISADINGELALRVAATGTSKDYYIDEYNKVKSALYGSDVNGLLSFVNGNLKLRDNEEVVIKTAQDDTGKRVAIRTDNGFDVVNSANNQTLGSVDGGYDKVVKVVQNETGSAPVVQATDSIDFEKNASTDKSITFTAKQLKIQKIASEGADTVTLTVKDGSTLRLAGGKETTDSLVVDKDDKAVLTDLVVEQGNAEIAGYDRAEIQQGTLNSVTMKDGTHTLGVATNLLSGTAAPTTNYVYNNLNIETTSGEQTQVNVLNASLVVNEMSMKSGSDNTIYIDPSYMQIASVADNKLSGKILVGEGSVLNIGNMENLAETVNSTNIAPKAEATGFTVNSANTVLALNGNYELTSNGKLIVDSTVQETGIDVRNTNGADVYFGDGSLLVVNGRKASKGAALSLNKSVAVNEAAKLYLTNVQAANTYTIFSGANKAATEGNVLGWRTLNTNLFMRQCRQPKNCC